MQIVIEIDDKTYERIKYLEPKADTLLDSLMMAIQNGTPLDEIITQIEQARDKDKNCGEYPYNRCIEIIKGVNNGLH